MSVANRVTYFLEDFILEDGKVGYGGAYLAGKGVVGYAVFVQIPGNLIEVAADPAVDRKSTFLNGGRLGVNEKARLRPGDSVGFADVRYVVEG